MSAKKRFDVTMKADLAREQEIRELGRKFAETTHFNYTECEAILKLHGNLTKETPLDRMKFRSFLFTAFEITHTFILDRIFHVVDENDDAVISGEEFLHCLSTMMRGTLDELTNFCYDVYDVNGDRSLAREELFMCLEGSIRPGRGIVDEDEVEDSIKDLVEIAMKKLDVNWDGQITYDDFYAAVQSDPLLLQVCGMCLPPPKYSRAVQYLLLVNYKAIAPVYKEDWAAQELAQKMMKEYHLNQKEKANPNMSSHARDQLLRKARKTIIDQRVKISEKAPSVEEASLEHLISEMSIASLSNAFSDTGKLS